VAAPAKPGIYVLQAGSFKKFTDADRRKAQLAFQGIESDIQQVELDGGQTWYRVFIGPTSNLAELEDHRSALRRADIDVLLLRKKQ
jgi:cell division protein FtsN